MPAGLGGLVELFKGNGQAQLPGRLVGTGGNQLAVDRRAGGPVLDLLVQRGEQGVIGGVLEQLRRVLAQRRDGAEVVSALQLGTRQQFAQF